MATNPYVNKVVSDNATLIDLTSDTVTPADVLAGVTFHDAAGATQVGTATAGKVIASIAPASVPAYADYLRLTGELMDWQNTKTQDFVIDVALGDTDSRQASDYYIDQVNAPEQVADGIQVRVADTSGSSVSYTSATEDPTQRTDTANWDGARWGFVSLLNELVYGSTWCNTVTNVNDRTRTIINGDGTSNLVGPVSVVMTRNESSQQTPNIAETMNNGATKTDTFSSTSSNSHRLSITEIAIDDVIHKPSGYAAGYLVTYTDGTTETFAAAAADIADGSY
jgi:hypothetical protein